MFAERQSVEALLFTNKTNLLCWASQVLSFIIDNSQVVFLAIKKLSNNQRKFASIGEAHIFFFFLHSKKIRSSSIENDEKL